MKNYKTIVVGYSLAAINSLQNLQPEKSVILIEEPDVLRKRSIEEEVKNKSVIDKIIPLEYQRPLAADVFYSQIDGSEITSVVPIVEYATNFAARLAERCKLPGATSAASMIFRDKHALRVVSEAHGIKNPQSKVVNSLEECVEFVNKHSGKAIIKPSNRQGSVGTVIVNNPSELEAAWLSSSDRNEGIMIPDREFPEKTLIEQYIEGTEFSVEALVQNGKFLFSNVTMKELFEGVNPVEKAHIVPAPQDTDIIADLIQSTEQLITAVGFETGIIHCEWKVSEGQCYLIECAGRFAGDGIIDLIERAYSFDLVGAYHQLMRGEKLKQLPQSHKQVASVRFLGGKSGVISSIEVDEVALSKPEIAYYGVMAKTGQSVRPPKMSWDRLASVTLVTDTHENLINAANQAEKAIVINYEHR